MNIENGEEEIFYSSSDWKEIVEKGNPCRSSDPDDYEQEEYIIWKKYYDDNQTSIKKISTPFEEVREFYLSLLGKLSRDDIAASLLEKFSESEKRGFKQ